jgi:hypothetical protein
MNAQLQAHQPSDIYKFREELLNVPLSATLLSDGARPPAWYIMPRAALQRSRSASEGLRPEQFLRER